jgi:hypothetical protein
VFLPAASASSPSSANAAVPSTTRCTPAANAAAIAARSSAAPRRAGRQPGLADDPRDLLEVDRLAAARAVEVDDVQPLGAPAEAQRAPHRADRRRTACAVEVALHEAHACPSRMSIAG